jgi:hypothetical protein
MLNWHVLMSLWQCVLVIPTNTIVYKQGFKKPGLNVKEGPDSTWKHWMH